MRNSEAQKYARWSLAVAGLLALAVAGVYGRNNWLARLAARRAPPAVPASVNQQSNEFSYSKVEGQRTIYTVRASRTTEFKEGSRNLLEDVAISVYGKKGERNDTLQTKACDFISSTGKMSCAGEVQIRLQAAGGAQNGANAIQVATSALSFDRESGEARTEQPVTFRWPQGDGRALGVIYNADDGTLSLSHDVSLNLSPTSAAKPQNTAAAEGKMVHVSGSSMSFQRDSRMVQLNGNVHAQQATSELHAEKLLLELDEQFQARRFVASGQPQLRSLGPGGPVALSADEIVSRLRPDGSIESLAASGNVRGNRSTPSGNDGIDAGKVEMDLATGDNLPRLLTASSGVTLTSTNAAYNGGTRRVQTDALEVHFVNNTASGQTFVESVNTLAPARVDWQSFTGAGGKAVAQATRMSGQRLNLKFDGQNQLQQLTGTGGVEVARKLGEAPEETTASRELIAKFDKNGEWSAIDQTGEVRFHNAQRSGESDRAHVDRATNTITLDGSVVFADAAMRTTAQSASFASASNALHADGHVQTIELHPSQSSVSNLSNEPAHISADHLVADTGQGHATYSGKGRLWQGPSVIEGDTIELDNMTHVLLVKGKVHGVFPQAAWNPKAGQGPGQAQSSSRSVRPVTSKATGQSARSATALGSVRGGLLTYWEAESRGRLEQDARVDSDQGSIQANVIDLYFSDGGAANGTKQLSRSVASGDVKVRQEDRRGTSGRAEYTASEGKFVLSEGQPTLYSSTGDTTTGRQLTFYFADDRILVDSADGSKTVTLHQVEK